MDNIENPYKNDLALKEALKMMKRKDIITISFSVDEFGYECAELDSKKVAEKFKLQLSYQIFPWLINYLRTGQINEPVPSYNDGLLKSQVDNTNDYNEGALNFLLAKDIDIKNITIVPEVVDKPDTLTVIYRYPYGCMIYKLRRSDDILEMLASKGL
ncbi:MAG: hypothetical protein J1F16_02920 [Muribaculaceae bacterium]|nr:hypothetical protein [Muribaculaceae bacterium]